MTIASKAATKGIVSIDLDRRELKHTQNGSEKKVTLDGPEAFEIVSQIWLRSGWASKYSYSFTWMGRPIIQIPEDMVRVQELIFQLKPDVIVEAGIAHGGSLIFYASLCKIMEKGRIIGVDIEIRPHNRKAIEEHELYPFISLIEASSIELDTLEKVCSQIKDGEKVLVILDSCHTKDHVLKELERYSSMVSKDSYIIVFDGIMKDVVGAPGAAEDWSHNNPVEAVREFVANNKNFELVEPKFLFNEGMVDHRITYFPGGIVQRVQ